MHNRHAPPTLIFVDEDPFCMDVPATKTIDTHLAVSIVSNG